MEKPVIRKWLLMLFLVLQTEAVFAGQLQTREIRSEILERSWPYSIYLPEGYDTSSRHYPVLYLLHGNSGNHLSWPGLGIENIADGLIASGDILPSIIVMPEASTTWYVDRKERMESTIINELLPGIENNYRVMTNRQARFVGGYSMGGYGAMRLALQYPELFGGAALLSPAIYNPVPPMDSSARRVGVFGADDFDAQDWQNLNYPSLWEGFLVKELPVPMYINSGDDDQFYIEAEATAFYSLLRRNNQPAELRIVNGGHTGEVWASTIADAMRYLLNDSPSP